MSIEYSNRVWANSELKGGKLLVMLALAHHADNKGECWPGMPLLIEKTRLTDRQIRRVLNDLDTDGTISIQERAIGRGKKPHYKLFPDEKADKMSDQKAEVMSTNNENVDTTAQESGQNVHLSQTDEIKADISDNKSGHLLHEKADISDTDYSHVRSESSIETSIEEEDEDDTCVSEPVRNAWHHYYSIKVPKNVRTPLNDLAAKHGVEATIHGIKVTAENKSHNFLYIAKSARNYIPEAKSTTGYTNVNGNGHSYHVDLPVKEPDLPPGVHILQPSGPPAAPPVFSPPMAHDDPWAVALAELLPTLSTQAADWLKDSRLSAESELAGEPFYQVLVSHPKADMQWLTQQLERAIRHKLRSLLGKRVNVAFVRVAEQEMV